MSDMYEREREVFEAILQRHMETALLHTCSPKYCKGKVVLRAVDDIRIHAVSCINTLHVRCRL